MTRLSELVQIEDPAFYDVANGAILHRLRAEAPVFYYEPLKLWVLSKYDDVRLASKTPEIFSVTKGFLLNDARLGYSVADSFFQDGAEMIMTLDPPRHGKVRRTMAPAFTPRVIAEFEDSVRETCRTLTRDIRAGEAIDFVDSIARLLPIQTLSEFLGVPADEVDIDKVAFWSDERMKMGAPLSPEELRIAAANTAEMDEWMMALLERKRENPGNDLISTLATADLDEKLLSAQNILMLATGALIAGNGTTRNLLAGMMWALAVNPEQCRLLAGDRTLCSNAVEETLRWITPVPGFVRWLQQDTQLRGQHLHAGEYVYLNYFAANRDEEYWTDADRFDITRPLEPSVLSFGYGQHVCIGAGLARMEARIFLEELFGRFDGVQLAGGPVRVESVMEHAWTELPIAFTARE